MESTRSPNISSNRGFTLFEVGMATVVAFVAVIGLVEAISVGSEMLDVAQKQSIATQLIRNEIDNVHLQEWSVIDAIPKDELVSIVVDNAGTGLASTSSTTAPLAFALTGYSSSHPDLYNVPLMAQAKSLQLDVTVTAMSGRADFLVINYVVSWTGGKQRKVYTRSGTTYYWKNGLNVYYRR